MHRGMYERVQRVVEEGRTLVRDLQETDLSESLDSEGPLADLIEVCGALLGSAQRRAIRLNTVARDEVAYPPDSAADTDVVDEAAPAPSPPPSGDIVW